MPDIQPGEVNKTMQSLLRLQKAKQKEGMPNGGVNVNRDLNNGFYTFNVIIPVRELETAEGTIIQAVEFVETKESTAE